MRNKIRTHIVIINGAPRVGKDTFVEAVSGYCDTDEVAFVHNISSVDPIKHHFKQLFGYNEDNKTDLARTAIASVKKMWQNNCSGPIIYMYNKIMEIHNTTIESGDDHIIFLHIREPNEIEAMCNIFSGMEPIGIGITTLLLRRRNVRTDFVCDSDANTSNYQYHHVFDNDGTVNDLVLKAIWFVKHILNIKE